MLYRLKHFVRRASKLVKDGDLTDAIARVRSWRAKHRMQARQSEGKRIYKEYSATLPSGYSARMITLRISVPPLPKRPLFAFSDHVSDEAGNMTRTVLAVADGGFAISRDLGSTWEFVRVKDRAHHRFVHIKSIGNGEFLTQVSIPGEEGLKNAVLDLLVVNEAGDVLVEHPRHSQRWHGCRAVDLAGHTLMYAEYPSNMPVKNRRPFPCRVFRSRDRGRNWQIVFERTGDQIRHFHFLQARPGFAGEWWLTSGDSAYESRIWVSKDDGDTWNDITESLPASIEAGGETFDHKMFRLTDLKWIGDEVVWATDDYLMSADPPGARVFRSIIGSTLAPVLVGPGKWHFRSIVDIGDFFLLISQRSNQPAPSPEERKPGIYLVPKRPVPGTPALVHLFDLDSYPSRAKAGFTFSKASRSAFDGTFFSFRSSEDVFPAGHKFLEWNVLLDGRKPNQTA